MNAKTLIKHGYRPLINTLTSDIIFETKCPIDSTRFIKTLSYYSNRDSQVIEEDEEWTDLEIIEDNEKERFKHLIYDTRSKKLNDSYNDINNSEDLKNEEKYYYEETYFSTNVSEVIYSYIYIIKSSIGYKIGKANDPFSRFSSIKTSNPDNLQLLYIFPIEREIITKVEKFLHSLFKEKKISGEWFNINENDIIIINALFYSLAFYSYPHFNKKPTDEQLKNHLEYYYSKLDYINFLKYGDNI